MTVCTITAWKGQTNLESKTEIGLENREYITVECLFCRILYLLSSHLKVFSAEKSYISSVFGYIV